MVQKQANMRDIAFSIIKERQISRLSFRQQTDYFALCSLLGCITQQDNTLKFKHHLNKT
jgi:hypothetical protein